MTKRKKMKVLELEKVYDERDDLECAVSLLKKASTCISTELESVQSYLAWIIEAVEEEVALLDDSIKGLNLISRRKGEEKCA